MTLARTPTITDFAEIGRPRADVQRPRLDPNADLVVALLVVAVAPALFWTLALGGTASLLGRPLGISALAAFAALIATFLALVCGGLMSNRS